MPDLTVVGAQWGDEGKGKVVDHLAATANLVVRFQGGPNAGHTVCEGGREFVLHQVPCGILTKSARNVIGCGCVIDPYVLNDELSALRRHRISVGRRLTIDGRAHLILPFHRLLDGKRDAGQRIGVTGRGIGPAYQDKVARTGIRAGDLLDEEVFRSRLKRNVAAANFLLMELYKAEPLSFKEMAEDYWRASRPLAVMVADTSRVVESALRKGERVLFEGAQGTHLDINLGTYPFVTSSLTSVAGVAAGTGISPLWLTEAVGVAKAYTTRVGEGPFPTELPSGEAEHLRKLGREYGATTGRPRRCGWFDAGLVRASVRHNRFSALVITKLDILDTMQSLDIGTGYRLEGRYVREFEPFHAAALQPTFATVRGWRETTSGCRRYRDLPAAARRYLTRLEDLCECPIALVSVGSDRRQTIPVQPDKLKWLKSG